jgi:hypothetical protein
MRLQLSDIFVCKSLVLSVWMGDLPEPCEIDCIPHVRHVKGPVGLNGASGQLFVLLRTLGCKLFAAMCMNIR